MDAKRITVGKRVRYRSRIHEGIAKVTDVYQGKTGTWVVVYDAKRRRDVTVRTTQVSSV